MIITNSDLCKKANTLNLKLYNFGYAVVNTQWQGYVQNPTVSRLYYITRGTAQITYNRQILDLTAGHWYLLPAGFSFGFHCADEMEHLYFHITLSGPDGIDLLSNLNLPIGIAENADSAEDFKQHLKNDTLFAALSVKEKVYNTVLKLLAKDAVLPEANTYSPCVQKAVKYINNHLSDKLDLANIADAVYVSKSTLTNKFKTEIKITVQEYIQSQRMFKAVQLLKSTNLSIAQISDKLGFSDQFYFSRCFKQNFGIAPREYRKSKID